MRERFHAVILAGGRGERFWPLSTARRPKQLLELVGRGSLLVQAARRLRGVVPPARTWVVTHADLAGRCRAALPELPPGHVVGEPAGRDTGAAVALGAALVAARDPEATFCVLSADQVVGDEPLFRATLRAGLRLAAREPLLVTIGVRPAAPRTCFGYIEAPRLLRREGRIRFLRARRFVEKPDPATARRYVAAGTYYWNAGLFVWSLPTLRAGLRRHAPHLAALADALAPRAGRPGFAAALRRAYATLPRISIDYALMEKASNLAVARAEFPWDDVGTWPALANHFPADADGNVAVGPVAALDAAGCIAVAGDRPVALLGVRDLVVVQAAGATLVCARDRADDVKALVARLRADRRFRAAL